MDASHDILAFNTTWARALAQRFQHVTVITMYVGELAVEPNTTVYSVGKELGHSEPRRLVEFYRLVLRALRERPINVCLAHQQPIFATLFAPVAKARGIPVLLWYAHGAVPLWLRAAHALVDRCISSSPAGFRLPSDKLFMVGQGIDTEVFRPPGPTQHVETHTAISIGRISPVKRLEEMIDAVSLVRQSGRDLRLRIIGGPAVEEDHRYLAQLRRRAHALAVDDVVSFEGAVPYRDVPASYHRGALFLNLSETRSLDKALLEAMASGCIPVSRNESFQAIARERGFEWLVPEPDSEGLARSIGQVLDLPADARPQLLYRLRSTVEEDHNLDGLMERITGHLEELATGARRPRRGLEDAEGPG